MRGRTLRSGGNLGDYFTLDAYISTCMPGTFIWMFSHYTAGVGGVKEGIQWHHPFRCLMLMTEAMLIYIRGLTGNRFMMLRSTR